MKAYFDSSAIVKLGHYEAESMALIDYVSEGDLWPVTSAIADIEVRRSLERQRGKGADRSEHLQGFFVVDISRDIRELSVTLGPSTLRSLDAIHLATALALDTDLDFITYDERLATAAREHGLRVVQPGR